MNNLSLIKSFPENFIFGTATSSYQIEGNDFGGAGKSHWDQFAKVDGMVFNAQHGQIACNHIKHWREDLQLVSDAGFGAYRFSFSWPRIIPEGRGTLNSEGLSFYDKLLDQMLELNLKPFGTFYHWDLPISLANLGGWANRDTTKYFADYSEVLMKNFGDRLYSVATINEPWCVAWLSYYLGVHAPGLKDITATAKAMHYVLLAHGYGMEVIRSFSHENAGIVLNKAAVESFSEKPEDVNAADLYEEIHNSWFSDAVFKSKYPKNLLDILGNYMPDEYEDDLKIIGAPLDWLGINYYTRNLIKFDRKDKIFQLTDIVGPRDKTDMNWEVYPEGLTKIIENEVNSYNLEIPIHITENGMANKDLLADGIVYDQKRVDYYFLHLQEVKNLIEKGYNIKSYFAWSLLDNFEWSFGYSKRFGLVYVDFENQKRIKKKSWHEFSLNLN
mgnify:FL=1